MVRMTPDSAYLLTILCRYPGSARERDQPSTCPGSEQDTRGDYEQVWRTDQRGEDNIQDHDCRIILQDLIEMVVRLQAQVEDGGKKVADMEEYIDSLLVKIIENSPVLLERNIITCKPGK